MNTARSFARQFDRLSAAYRPSCPFHARTYTYVCVSAQCVCVLRCQRKLKTSRAIDDDEFMRKFNYSTINRADSTPTKDHNVKGGGGMVVGAGAERRANNRWKINADWRQMVINQSTKTKTGRGRREKLQARLDRGPQRLMKNDIKRTQ